MQISNICYLFYKITYCIIFLGDEIIWKNVSVIKCNGNMVIHYDIGKPISSCNYNFADTFAKLLR